MPWTCLHSDEELVKRIQILQGVGYNASEQDSLPVLFKDVYGIELKRCQDCYEKAKKALNKWAEKKSNQQNKYMAYSIKPEYHKKDFVFRHAGKVVVVNSTNLTEERAEWMLASPYAHAIVGQREKTEDEIYEKDLPKQNDKVETGKLEEIPNESEVVTASTSTEAKADGTQSVHVVKGRLSKLPESEQKRGRGRPKVEKSLAD